MIISFNIKNRNDYQKIFIDPPAVSTVTRGSFRMRLKKILTIGFFVFLLMQQKWKKLPFSNKSFTYQKLLGLKIYRTRAIRPRSIYSIFHFLGCGLFEKTVYSRRWSIKIEDIPDLYRFMYHANLLLIQQFGIGLF